MNVIAIEQLTKRYGSRIGIQDLNLAVPEGAIFGFLGPNGSGKTTTIRVLLGLLRPNQGRACVFGHDCWTRGPSVRAEIGYLPGDLRLYPWLTCVNALRIFGWVRRRELAAEGSALAEDFDLEPDLRVCNMSRGTRQKLGLVLALAHKPKLLILDEPTASLDPIVQQKLFRHLRKLASGGHTVFFSSHTLSEVEHLCDRVAILRKGRLVADETLEAMRQRAKRWVTIRWRRDAKTDEIRPPESLHIIEKRDREWHATLAGSAGEFVRWIAKAPIDDLTIGQPDLATLFQEYYG